MFACLFVCACERTCGYCSLFVRFLATCMRVSNTFNHWPKYKLLDQKVSYLIYTHARIYWCGTGDRPPPGKSHVTIGFLINSGTDTHRKAIRPLGSNCFSGEVHTALCEIHSWQKKTLSGPPPPPPHTHTHTHSHVRRFWIRACIHVCIPYGKTISNIWHIWPWPLTSLIAYIKYMSQFPG